MDDHELQSWLAAHRDLMPWMQIALEDAWLLIGCIVDELDSPGHDRAADANLETIARALQDHIAQEAPPEVFAAVMVRSAHFGRPIARSDP
jgi:hypothetical protein